MATISETVKKYIGLPSDDTGFDTILSTAVYNAIMNLREISNEEIKYPNTFDGTWDEVQSGLNESDPMVRYICIKAQMAYDPPNSSIVSQALDAEIKELEFRISVRGA